MPRQWPSKASSLMYWSRFHSTNFQGPVPTGAVAPKAWSPTFSMCFLGTMGKKTSRSRSRGKGLSVTIWTVSGATIFTSLMARTLPYCGDFLVWSMTRSKEYFTSSAVRGSPLWNLTPRRSLNSHTVSETAFQDVARDGSYSSLAFRWSNESNMLMLTRMPDPLEVHVRVHGRGVGGEGDGQRVLGLGLAPGLPTRAIARMRLSAQSARRVMTTPPWTGFESAESVDDLAVVRSVYHEGRGAYNSDACGGASPPPDGVLHGR